MSGALPGRAELAERTLLLLKRGGRLSADVLLVETGRGRAVVKDWGGCGWAPLGRRLARREARTYRRLGDHPAVPRFLGFVDALAFGIEYRPGPRISRRHPRIFSPAFDAALAEAVRGLHARGVVHLDLRHRSNVRADTAGRPVLVDFGAALRFRPGGWAARWILPWLARIDERALAKWKKITYGVASRPSPRDGGGASESGRSISRPR